MSGRIHLDLSGRRVMVTGGTEASAKRSYGHGRVWGICRN